MTDPPLQEGERPRLKRHFSIVSHSEDVVELRHGVWSPVSFTLRDDSASGALRRVLTGLDGTRSIAEIAAGESVPIAEVEALVHQLSELQLIEDAPAHALDFFLDHLSPNLLPYPGARAKGAEGVVVLGGGELGNEVERILRDSAITGGFEVTRAPEGLDLGRSPSSNGSTDGDPLAFEEGADRFSSWRGRLLVMASSTIDPIELRTLNRISLHHRIPWVQAAVDGPFLLIGPTFVPHRSPCYECLETRVLMNLREASSYQRYKEALAAGRVDRSTAPLDGILRTMTASMTAFEVLNYLLTGTGFTVGKLLSVYLPTMEFTFNEVLRLPGCQACGSTPERDERELYFDVRTLFNGKQ